MLSARSIVFVLPEGGKDHAAALVSGLGIAAYDARQSLGIPGFARPVKVFPRPEEAQAAAGALTKAGLTARVFDDDGLAALRDGWREVSSWEQKGSLVLWTGDGETIELQSARLASVVRVQRERAAAAKAPAKAAGSATRSVVAQAAGIGMLGVGGGYLAKKGLDALTGGNAGTVARPETDYLLALQVHGRVEPLFVDPGEVKGPSGSLGSPFVLLERALASILPVAKWTTLRSLPGAQLLGADALSLCVLATAAMRS
jgi:hypothetical protein